MTKRIVYIDQIKVFLTCLVVAHHAGQAYGPTGGVWVVDDPLKTNWLGQFFFVNASYMMGLYFFISGYFMVFSTARKTAAGFMTDRLKRLGIPLAFFTLFVFLPFNFLTSGSDEHIAVFFWKTYFYKPPVATGHLWFVASLLVYSSVFLLFFKKWLTKANTEKSFRWYYIPMYIFLLAGITALVRLRYPIDEWRTWLIPLEPAHLPQYFSLFLLGAMFNYKGWLHTLPFSWGIVSGMASVFIYILTFLLPLYLRQNIWVESLMETCLCIGISLFLLTVVKQYGNKSNRLLDQLSANAYGIYLFHLFIVIALQQWMLQWNSNANLKFVVVTVAGILLSMGLSALLRMNKWLRKII